MFVELKKKLGALCERGEIAKTTKNRFASVADGDIDVAIYNVCAELVRYFSECGPNDGEFLRVCEAVRSCVEDSGKELKGFERDIAVVCAYLSLTERANKGDVSAFSTLERHSEVFYGSLENIKYRMPLFDTGKAICEKKQIRTDKK